MKYIKAWGFTKDHKVCLYCITTGGRYMMEFDDLDNSYIQVELFYGKTHEELESIGVFVTILAAIAHIEKLEG